MGFIFGRRSIRAFAPQAVSNESVQKLLEAAMAAPSAAACDPWRFVVVRNRQLLLKINDVLPFGKMLATTALGIVVCGDLEAAHDKQLSYPLVFSALIYKFRLAARGLFLSMIAGIVLVEIVFTHNRLLLTLPICLLAIPLSLAHYGMVTFMPLWIAERTLSQNRRWAAATLSGWVVGVLLNIMTQFSNHQ